VQCNVSSFLAHSSTTRYTVHTLSRRLIRFLFKVHSPPLFSKTPCTHKFDIDKDWKPSLLPRRPRDRRQLHRAPRRPYFRHASSPHRRARASRTALCPVLPSANGLLDRRQNALSFRTLSAHSRLRPDLIAAGIATKSTADVAVYLSLLRDGAAAAAL
jgi:hypothetical protein